MKIPFLHNVRRGLATNSSSSHSLVYHSTPVSSDVTPGKFVDTEFGWGHFYLDTLGEKLVYALTARIGQNWWRRPSPEEQSALLKSAREQWGELFPELDDDSYWINALRGYVDHQSMDVAYDLDSLRDPKVAVEGGNDNE